MPYTITVTLTSLKDPLDQRTLTITHGTPTSIGRASRTGNGNLQPSRLNAFFASPVVSRNHAELKVNQWAPAGEQIALTDKGSMHGTFVNGRRLAEFKPMVLKTGDVLQFGAQVSRGSETHDGIAVTYASHDFRPYRSADFHVDFTSNTQQTPSTQFSSPPATRGYHVPDASDNESDMLSDDGYSISSDCGHESEITPTKTSPEQAKSTPGSAEQPIELESSPPPPPPPRPPIINLSDDEEDLYGSPHTPAAYRPQSPVLSNFGKLSSPKPSTVNLRQELVDDIDSSLLPPLLDDAADERESVLDHNTGLTALLKEPAETTSELDYGSGDSEDSDMHEELDYPDEDEDRLNQADENDDAEQDDRSSHASFEEGRRGGILTLHYDGGSESYSAKKQASPELGSTQAPPPPSTGPPKSFTSYSSADPKGSAQPRYDPVRASVSGSNDSWAFSSWEPQVSTSQPSSKPYTYATLPASDTVVSPHANVSSSSRWDIVPDSFVSQPAKPSGSVFSYTPDYSHSYDYSFPRARVVQPFWSIVHTPEELANTAVKKTAATKSATEAETSPAVVNKKIRVGDLIEADVHVTERGADNHADKPDADSMSDRIVVNPKKRKADDMTITTPLDPPTSPIDTTGAPQHDPTTPLINPVTPLTPLTPDSPEPPARRRKIEEAPPVRRVNKLPARRNAMRDVAKYTAAAAVGSVGTVAFLLSPMVDKVIRWFP